MHVEGLKIAAPHFQRSEAGVAWSLGGGLSLQLHYERGAYAPMMRRDHDDFEPHVHRLCSYAPHASDPASYGRLLFAR